MRIPRRAGLREADEVRDSRRARRWTRALGALLLGAGVCLATLSSRDAAALGITLDTTSLARSSGRFEFLLLAVDSAANNSATISNIVTDGTPAGTDCSVGCSGGPLFVLDDGGGIGQLLYDLTVGKFFRFDVAVTSNPGSLFALSLLDPETNFSLVATNLIFPRDALLTIDLIDGGVVQVASFTDARIGIAVPEPGSMTLAALALAVLGWQRPSISRVKVFPPPYRLQRRQG